MGSTFRNKLMGLLFTAMFLAHPTGHAVLIPLDAGLGPGSGTLDTNSNLVFLDVNFTTGLSFNDVQAQLGPSGVFAGFRYATVSEVIALFNSSGLFALNPISDTPLADEAAFFSFVDLLDIPAIDVLGTGDVLAYRGITADAASVPFPARRVAELVIDRFTIDPSSSEIFSSTGAFLANDIAAAPSTIPPDGAGVRSSGSWLVRSNVVPAPSPLSLLALGFFVLGLCRDFTGRPADL